MIKVFDLKIVTPDMGTIIKETNDVILVKYPFVDSLVKYDKTNFCYLMKVFCN